MDAAAKEKLLQDPVVQEAIKKAGQDALQNPAVQQAIINTAKEKYPELAEQARVQVVEWAKSDQAKEMARNAASAVASAPQSIISLIEQGPTGVRILTFSTAVASFILSILYLLDIFSPIHFLIAVYQMFFSITTMLFEMNPTWIAWIPLLGTYQNGLIENAHFLTKSWGRGLFYVFQGTLWLGIAGRVTPFTILIGILVCAVGALHVAMHFGVMPKTVAETVRKIASNTSQSVRSFRGATPEAQDLAGQQLDVEEGNRVKSDAASSSSGAQRVELSQK